MHTPTTSIYTLSLHDALPIYAASRRVFRVRSLHPSRSSVRPKSRWERRGQTMTGLDRSEEHTSELQSRRDLVCRLLLEKKKDGIAKFSFGRKTSMHGTEVGEA